MDPRRTPALLTTPEYLGTLAAARCLGARGVPVVVASSTMLGPARWSRAVGRVVRSPDVAEPSAILEWLMGFGKRHCGMVLHPTSDEMVWLVARHQDDLARVFRLYTPPFDTIRSLLDKANLDRAARAAGLAVPKTFFPRDEDEAAELARAHRALVLKPRAQVFYSSHFKGQIVRDAESARDAWRTYTRSPHAAAVVSDAPDLDKPLLQELVPNDGVRSIAGFVTRDGTVLATRASRKVLQRPHAAGVGVSFEATDVDPHLERSIGVLAKRLGFFGAFEAELVGRERKLIDFNPRYYGQMGFDVARGAPLPWLLHLAAHGHESSLAEEAASFVAFPPRAYEDALVRMLISATQRLTGGEPARAPAFETMDATYAPDDPLPAVASAASTFLDAARHPRGFWRSLVR